MKNYVSKIRNKILLALALSAMLLTVGVQKMNAVLVQVGKGEYDAFPAPYFVDSPAGDLLRLPVNSNWGVYAHWTHNANGFNEFLITASELMEAGILENDTLTSLGYFHTRTSIVDFGVRGALSIYLANVDASLTAYSTTADINALRPTSQMELVKTDPSFYPPAYGGQNEWHMFEFDKKFIYTGGALAVRFCVCRNGATSVGSRFVNSAGNIVTSTGSNPQPTAGGFFSVMGRMGTRSILDSVIPNVTVPTNDNPITHRTIHGANNTSSTDWCNAPTNVSRPYNNFLPNFMFDVNKEDHDVMQSFVRRVRGITPTDVKRAARRDANVPVLQFQIQISGNLPPSQQLSNIVFSSNNTTAGGKLSNVKLYYTGTSQIGEIQTFNLNDPSTQWIATLDSATANSGTFSFNFSPRTFSTNGIYNFWLT